NSRLPPKQTSDLPYSALPTTPQSPRRPLRGVTTPAAPDRLMAVWFAGSASCGFVDNTQC
ncbi:MAG: hypothetical protein RLY17_1515, partial [Pseudomonadota bacterium]